MYTIILSSAVALLVGVGGAFLDWWGWIGGILLGFLAFAIIWVIILRRISKQLGPTMARVQKLAEGRSFALAITSLETMLPLCKWMPMLRGQIVAQMGVLSHYAGDKSKAAEHLKLAPRRSGDAKMLLAAIKYSTKNYDEAIAILDAAAPYNRKSALLANVAAWMLQKRDRTGDAIARLVRYTAKDSDNAPTKDNLLRLQNGKKLTMKPFGMAWYALGLEHPPAQQQQFPGANAGRKGFRQPPKAKSKRR